jgi:prepilin-type N-terminal cleavage/methylation domain-containing protein
MRARKLVMKEQGFTLVEALLALAIAAILMAAVLSTVIVGYKASSSMERRIAVQQDVRAVLDMMAAEIQMASFNRVSGFNNSWADATSCALCTGSNCTLRKGIPLADSNTLTVAMNTTENTCIGKLCAGGTDPNEVIKYQYITTGNTAADTNYIARNVNCAGNQAFIGDLTTTSAQQRNVAVINGELQLPVFQYYDGAGNELTAVPLSAADTANIQRIKITIAVRSLVPDLEGHYRVMTETTSVIPRNHMILLQ